MFWMVKYWEYWSRDQGCDSTVALTLHKNKDLQGNVKNMNFLIDWLIIRISSNLLRVKLILNVNSGTAGPMNLSQHITSDRWWENVGEYSLQWVVLWLWKNTLWKATGCLLCTPKEELDVQGWQCQHAGVDISFIPRADHVLTCTQQCLQCFPGSIRYRNLLVVFGDLSILDSWSLPIGLLFPAGIP